MKALFVDFPFHLTGGVSMARRGFLLRYVKSDEEKPVVVLADNAEGCAKLLGLALCESSHCGDRNEFFGEHVHIERERFNLPVAYLGSNLEMNGFCHRVYVAPCGVRVLWHLYVEAEQPPVVYFQEADVFEQERG